MKNDKTSNQTVSRRSALAATTMLGSVTALGTTVPAKPAQAAVDNDISVAADGKYERADLKKDVIKVIAIQSQLIGVDSERPKPQMRKNLDKMIELIDSANGFIPGKQDLLCFHEQPIMGWQPWNRDEALKVAIEVPGPETEALGKKAREHGCYIAFGSYVRDEENWPGHLLLTGVLIGPSGEVVANHWKQHNVRLNPAWTMFTTSAYDVLPRYIEMYGEDAVLPVARTDIGNLALVTSPYDPDIHRALALKGTEIEVRFSSGGFSQTDSKSSSFFNGNYTITCNQSMSPDQPGFPDAGGSGGTSIYGPRGVELGMAKTIHEEFVGTRINMSDFRRRHKLPDMPKALVMPVYEKYQPPWDPGLSLDYIPDDLEDSARYLNGKRNW